MNTLAAQGLEAGATPTVLTAAGKEVKRCAYYGPGRFGDTRGPISDANVSGYALDRDKQMRLWKKVRRSWDLSGVFKTGRDLKQVAN